jgi:hypothetical protein
VILSQATDKEYQFAKWVYTFDKQYTKQEDQEIGHTLYF